MLYARKKGGPGRRLSHSWLSGILQVVFNRQMLKEKGTVFNKVIIIIQWMDTTVEKCGVTTHSSPLYPVSWNNDLEYSAIIMRAQKSVKMCFMLWEHLSV